MSTTREPAPASRIEAANRSLLADGDTDAVDRFFAADYVAHLTDQKTLRGRDGVRKFLKAVLTSFSDVEVDVEILVENGDRIAWQRTVRAIHHKSFKGFPATNRPIVWREMVTSRLEDGLIAEEWVISDLAERLLLARHKR